MEYRKIMTVSSLEKAKDISELLVSHGIATKITQCQPVDDAKDCPWMVLVYEGDYGRARYIVEEL